MLTALFMSAALAGSWETKHQVALSWFPKGLRYAFTAEYRIPTWTSDSILFEDVYVAPGAYAEVTPAFARAGARVHFVPIAVLDVEAEALATGYFGTFSGVTDFDVPDTDFSEGPRSGDLDGIVVGGRELTWLRRILPALFERAVPPNPYLS